MLTVTCHMGCSRLLLHVTLYVDVHARMCWRRTRPTPASAAATQQQHSPFQTERALTLWPDWRKLHYLTAMTSGLLQQQQQHALTCILTQEVTLNARRN